MAADEVHVGDIGTEFIVTVMDSSAAVNISAATTKQIWLRKPTSETVLQKAADFVNAGADGKIKYTSVSGDLSEDGIWHIQAYIVLGGNTFHTDVGSFRVHENLA